MKKVLCMAAVAALVAVSSVSAQTTLTIGLEINGTSDGYLVTGELSGDASEGLALWGVDVNSDVSGIGALTAGAGMSSFVKNDGLTNPAGYGGTASGDYDLLQVGGGQNTINNNSGNAPYPIGAVVTGIASTKITLAEGACVAGETITLANGFANVIDLGETGPVFAVTAADIVLGTPLLCEFDECPALTGAASMGTHAGVGDLGLDIPLGGSLVEPRVQGSGELWIELQFDGDVTPGDITTTMPGATVVAGADSTKVNLTFAAAVADGGYAVDISCGGDVIGSFCIVYLSADVDGGGIVAGLDNAAISASWAAAADASVAATRADVDRSGLVAGLDNAAVSANWAAAASCP